ncbi:hypothetical protein D3C85_1085640 [compost metagenome]
MVPIAAFPSTTCPGSRSASARESVLSAPHAAVATSTASMPHSCVVPLRPWSNTKATPPTSKSSIAPHTRRSIVSWYSSRASTAVNSASSVSINEALVPLVCCNPQASATGPSTAPKAAIDRSRGKSLRITRASLSMRWRDANPMAAAPA